MKLPFRAFSIASAVLLAGHFTFADDGHADKNAEEPAPCPCDCQGNSTGFSTGALANMSATDVFRTLKENSYHFEHEVSKETVYVVEGDVLANEDELRQHALSLIAKYDFYQNMGHEESRAAEFNSKSAEISPDKRYSDATRMINEAYDKALKSIREKNVINLRANGVEDYWPDNLANPDGPERNLSTSGRPLRYCVMKNLWGSSQFAQYQKAVNDMHVVTTGGIVDTLGPNGTDRPDGWSEVCNVSFLHVSEYDDTPASQLDSNGFPLDESGKPAVDFTVRPTSQTGFVASAFFPEDTYLNPARCHVLVGPTYFTIGQQGFNEVGIMRHEVGHLLGCRHEHIRPEAPNACPNESLITAKPKGTYDPQSVMHYFCGGAGTQSLHFSAADIKWMGGPDGKYPLPTNAVSFVSPVKKKR